MLVAADSGSSIVTCRVKIKIAKHRSIIFGLIDDGGCAITSVGGDVADLREQGSISPSPGGSPDGHKVEGTIGRGL